MWQKATRWKRIALTLPAQARVMKIHCEFELSSRFYLSQSPSPAWKECTRLNRMEEQRNMHRWQPIKNELLEPLPVFYQRDTISGFHYESCATNQICVSQDKKCTTDAHIAQHLFRHEKHSKIHPIDDTLSWMEFRLRIFASNKRMNSSSHNVIKCLAFSLIVNSIYHSLARPEDKLPVCNWM